MTAQSAVKTRLIDTIGNLDLHESTEGNLYATAAGENKPCGGAWGPAADNDNWFAWRAGTDPIRVDSRDAAIDYITAPTTEEAA
jgi:hypothetical protein